MTHTASHPSEGLYAFVKAHLIIINNVVVVSGTLVAVLDFMAPRLSLLPKLVYSATAMLALAMLTAALVPAFAVRLWALVGRQLPANAAAVWRWPGWQFGMALLTGVSIIGFASVARASQGGLIASAFPSAKSLQETLFSVQADVVDIKSGVGQANEKLDRLSAAVDPDNAADRCADLSCAIYDGASPKAIKRLFAKGAQVPGNPLMDGKLLLGAALASSAGRFEVLDLLAQKGIDRNQLLLPTIFDSAKLTKQGKLAAVAVIDASNINANPAARGPSVGDPGLDAWNIVAGCFKRTSGGASLIEVAALLGDADLIAHLRERGTKLPSRPLACSWRVAGKSGFARVEFDPATGKYVGVSAR